MRTTEESANLIVQRIQTLKFFETRSSLLLIQSLLKACHLVGFCLCGHLFTLTLVSQKVSDTTKTEYSNLISLTGVSEAPIDDRLALDEARVPGSCEWLDLKGGYTTWKSAWSFNRPIFWLTGDAGCGKSILSSYVINGLDESNIKCSNFYFKQGNASKSTITGCLLSLAFQMGQSDETILRRISKLSEGLKPGSS